jgi:hypothetical protein
VPGCRHERPHRKAHQLRRSLTKTPCLPLRADAGNNEMRHKALCSKTETGRAKNGIYQRFCWSTNSSYVVMLILIYSPVPALTRFLNLRLVVMRKCLCRT